MIGSSFDSQLTYSSTCVVVAVGCPDARLEATGKRNAGIRCRSRPDGQPVCGRIAHAV